MNKQQRRWVRQLSARATPLWSRKPTLDSKDGTGSDDGQLQRWRAVLGSDKLLRRRLQILPGETPLTLLARTKVPRSERWTKTLGAILFDTNPGEVARSPQQQIAFADVFDVFVKYAEARLRSEAGRALRALRPTAVLSFERDLLEHLTFIANLVTGKKFYDFRFEHAPVAAFEQYWTALPTSQDLYRAFVLQMRSGGLLELLDEYPVLARLLAQSVDAWVVTVVQFCKRFESDFRQLARVFELSYASPEGVIDNVDSRLSDRHAGGHTVVELVLVGGERLIYKPRSVKAEVVFYRFLKWFNAKGIPLSLKILRGLDRNSYGWMECVNFEPCHSTDEVEKFYERAGLLLAVLHALAVTDIHCENLIACGENPVVIDLETLLNQSPGRPRRSVLESGFLPRGRRGEPDFSALTAEPAPYATFPVPKWRGTNTDQMMLEMTTPSEMLCHRPRLRGTVVSACDYLGCIRSGFQSGYDKLMEYRHNLLSSGLLKAFNGLRLRILLRDSATYAQLHTHLLHPEFLRDGIERSIELEWLARPLCARRKSPGSRFSIYQHELRAMERLDIPHFDTAVWRAMGHHAMSYEARVFGGSRDSSVLRKRLASMSARAGQRHLAAITMSFRRKESY